MRTTPPPGSRRVSDWVGKRIRTRVEMRNGYASVPAGHVGVVSYAVSGLQINFDPCGTCGVHLLIRKVDPRDVEVLP